LSNQQETIRFALSGVFSFKISFVRDGSVCCRLPVPAGLEYIMPTMASGWGLELNASLAEFVRSSANFPDKSAEAG
jgi:hypothetical protein